MRKQDSLWSIRSRRSILSVLSCLSGASLGSYRAWKGRWATGEQPSVGAVREHLPPVGRDAAGGPRDALGVGT